MKSYDDGFVQVRPLLEIVGDWSNFINEDEPGEEIDRHHLHERTGRPLGDEDFLERIEKLIGRDLRRQKPGPKKKGHQS